MTTNHILLIIAIIAIIATLGIGVIVQERFEPASTTTEWVDMGECAPMDYENCWYVL